MEPTYFTTTVFFCSVFGLLSTAEFLQSTAEYLQRCRMSTQSHQACHMCRAKKITTAESIASTAGNLCTKGIVAT